MDGTAAPARVVRGLTLIETMVAASLVALMASIATPAYLSQVHAARRTEAITTLSQIQHAQERWRSSCPCYAGSLTAPAGCPATDCAATNGLALAPSSPRFVYSMPIAPTVAEPNSYTVRATALGTQAADRVAGTSCAQLEIRVVNGVPANHPPACWRQ